MGNAQPKEQRSIARVVLMTGCLMLASCDQFARVGAPDAVADAEAPADAMTPSDGGPDAEQDDGSVDAGESCPPASVAVCDPVKNQGCSGALGMQCAIDYAWALTGYCIFLSPPAPGMTTECFNSGVTESCPPTFTCFADHCEKICLCDDDCDAGSCCTQPVASTGFSVCGDC